MGSDAEGVLVRLEVVWQDDVSSEFGRIVQKRLMPFSH